MHAVPRTITEGEAAMYIGLTGSRYPLHCSAEFARSLGHPRETVNDLLVFHIVFGKTVNDVSLNAVANLGYAGVRFMAPVYSGDTVRSISKVVGKKENSNGKTGVVWVKTVGTNQRGETVLEYYRWVMVHKRDPSAPRRVPTIGRNAKGGPSRGSDRSLRSRSQRLRGLAIGRAAPISRTMKSARRSTTSTA